MKDVSSQESLIAARFVLASAKGALNCGCIGMGKSACVTVLVFLSLTSGALGGEVVSAFFPVVSPRGVQSTKARHAVIGAKLSPRHAAAAAAAAATLRVHESGRADKQEQEQTQAFPGVPFRAALFSIIFFVWSCCSLWEGQGCAKKTLAPPLPPPLVLLLRSKKKALCGRIDWSLKSSPDDKHQFIHGVVGGGSRTKTIWWNA